MLSALERRQAMLERLSDTRHETVSSLMIEFGVSRRTVLRDVQILICSYSIYTVVGHGGGIYMADGFYIGRRYLRPDQKKLLETLVIKESSENAILLQEIIIAFGMPEISDAKKEGHY